MEDATPHFLGPLFPAVRRTAKTPSSTACAAASSFSDLRVPTGKEDGSSELGISSFSDREWVYPSFLGAYPAKSRVSNKGKTTSFKSREDDILLGSIDGGRRSFDTKREIIREKQRIDAQPAIALKPKQEEREVNSTVSQATVTHTNSSRGYLALRTTQGLSHSLVIYLVL